MNISRGFIYLTTPLFVMVSMMAQIGYAQSEDLKLAAKCREILNGSLIDFYLPNSIDKKFGGYLEVLDAEGRFAESEKFLTLQARQVWFFSALANAGIRKEESLSAASSGYEFLTTYFYDKENGGYFAKTARDGSPVDRRKHVYPNAFVIYAFVEYYRASGEDEALAKAIELFSTLESKCYDSQFGGYQEFFYDDWALITDPEESGYVGAINTKTYNSHLHILEALTQLYLETKDPLVGDRLSELIDINTLSVKHPDYPCNIDGWNRNWTMIESERNLRASYGHDVECSWLVLDAAKALGRSTATLRSWAETICDYSLKHGWDETNQGLCYTGPLGGSSDDRKKVWWTQSEAMVAMLTLYDLTDDPRYRTKFDSVFEFVQKHHLAEQGGWWANLKEDGSVGDDKVRTSMWQGAYHNGRALLICERMLKNLAKSQN